MWVRSYLSCEITNKLSAVGQIGPMRGHARPFRVPLNPEDGHVLVFQSFNDAVMGGLSDGQPGSDDPGALVMGAVDQTGCAVEPGQKRAGQTVRRVDLVLAVPAVGIG